MKEYSPGFVQVDAAVPPTYKSRKACDDEVMEPILPRVIGQGPKNQHGAKIITKYVYSGIDQIRSKSSFGRKDRLKRLARFGAVLEGFCGRTGRRWTAARHRDATGIGGLMCLNCRSPWPVFFRVPEGRGSNGTHTIVHGLAGLEALRAR